MAHLELGTYGPQIPSPPPLPKNDHALTGLGYANAAIDFAALGNAAEKAGIGGTPLHLYALAIELAFKAVAILFGASPDDCKKASHRITKVIELIETRGGHVPEEIVRQLADDQWFKKMLDQRYPIFKTDRIFDDTLFYHRGYPARIARILSIPCPIPLGFDGGSALEEIMNKLRDDRKRRK